MAGTNEWRWQSHYSSARRNNKKTTSYYCRVVDDIFNQWGLEGKALSNNSRPQRVDCQKEVKIHELEP